jgi:osmotically inducible lipoprotein OsmB
MIKSKILMIVAAASFLGGCENMSSGQKGAVAGGALGTGIGMVAGGSFGQVVALA